MKTTSSASRYAMALIPALLGATASAATTADSRKVLDFCLAHPDNCSISVNHLSDKWEAHYHGNRLNVLASTLKIVPLIAYGEAVSQRKLDPNTKVNRDDWARSIAPVW